MGGGALQGMMGGAAAPAAAEAMGGANPLMAGLMGGAVPGMAAAKGMFPPMPEKNPAFHGGAQENAAAKAIKDSPAAMSAFAGLMSKPSGPGSAAPPTPAQQGGDSGGSFAAKPWRNETVFGNDITGQNWKPSRGNITLPEATPNAMPLPERNENFHAAPKLSGTASTTMFGGTGTPPTAAPQAPQGAQTAQAAKPQGMFEAFTGKKIPGLDVVQNSLRAVPTNPLVQTGLGLLASGYDGSNPYANIAANLKGIQPHEIALRSADIADSAEGRKKKDAADEAKDAELRAMIAQMLMSGMPGAAGAAAGSGATAGSQGQARLVR